MADNSIGGSTAKITRSRVGTRAVITLGGAVTPRDIETLDHIKNELTEENRNEVILDLKSVSFLDSASLEYILKLHIDLKSRSGYLKLINVNSLCRDIFVATRLINTFLIFQDIHEAIKN